MQSLGFVGCFGSSVVWFSFFLGRGRWECWFVFITAWYNEGALNLVQFIPGACSWPKWKNRCPGKRKSFKTCLLFRAVTIKPEALRYIIYSVLFHWGFWVVHCNCCLCYNLGGHLILAAIRLLQSVPPHPQIGQLAAIQAEGAQRIDLVYFFLLSLKKKPHLFGLLCLVLFGCFVCCWFFFFFC